MRNFCNNFFHNLCIDYRIRGRLGALLLLSCNLGILFAFVIGEVFDYFTVSLCHLAIPLLFYVGVIFVKESPLFLLQKGKYRVRGRKARANLFTKLSNRKQKSH